MAKYEKLQEPVFVTKNTPKIGRNQQQIHELQLKGIVSKRDYVCWVDETMMNWRWWDEIIHYANTKGQVLSNLKFKDKDTGLINADSQVQCNYRVSNEELADILEDFWGGPQRGLFE